MTQSVPCLVPLAATPSISGLPLSLIHLHTTGQLSILQTAMQSKFIENLGVRFIPSQAPQVSKFDWQDDCRLVRKVDLTSKPSWRIRKTFKEQSVESGSDSDESFYVPERPWRRKSGTPATARQDSRPTLHRTLDCSTVESAHSSSTSGQRRESESVQVTQKANPISKARVAFADSESHSREVSFVAPGDTTCAGEVRGLSLSRAADIARVLLQTIFSEIAIHGLFHDFVGYPYRSPTKQSAWDFRVTEQEFVVGNHQALFRDALRLLRHDLRLRGFVVHALAFQEQRIRFPTGPVGVPSIRTGLGLAWQLQ